jgi:RIO-like serine/threonine protein kinase
LPSFVSFKLAFIDNVLVQEKESVYLAVDPSGTQCILKFIDWEELFSNVRKKRDYFIKRELRRTLGCFSSTLCLEGIRLMKALYDVGYPPTPIAHNRHIVCMS